jgi:glycosyltransferase involved in cell wall biosynthesis
MRIAHIISSLDPAAGGPPMVATRLAAAQAGLGHDVELVAYEPSAAVRSNIDRAMAGLPNADCLAIHFIPSPRGFARITASDAYRDLRKRPPFNIMHMHGVWNPIIRAAARAATDNRIPYVITPHGTLDPWSLQQRPLKKRLALAFSYRSMLNHATFIHTLNEDEKRLLDPLKLTAPCEVIPNGIFLEEIAELPPAGTFRTAHPELENGPFVLFLSRLHYKKGLDYLADSFVSVVKQVSGAQLVVAGPDEGARADFEKQIDQLGIAGRVHLVGPLYGRDKLAALVDAAVFCLPSRQEGFSIAIIEALACGLPVVISDQCHFPEVAEADAGFITPLEPGVIAASIATLLADESLRKKMGAAGSTLVRTCFTWPKVAERTTELYQRYGA